jgi:hypothetical protein
MTDSLPFAIAAVTGLLTLALFGGVALVISLATAIKGGSASVGEIAGRIFGVAAICLLPLGFVSIPGLLAAALVDGLGTPPIALPFVSVAGLAGLRGAKDAGSGEMAGCSRIIGMFVASYVAVWGAVAWWMSGGPATLDADLASLKWLQPPLAALPFSLALWRLAGRKRTLWLLFGSLAIFSAWFAIWFFTVEAGFADRLLPAQPWLRFPLAGLATALFPVLLPLAGALHARGAARARRLRDLARNLGPIALVTLAMGFAWLGARAAVVAV